MGARLLLLTVAVLAAGCADSCACGDGSAGGGADGTGSPADSRSAQPAQRDPDAGVITRAFAPLEASPLRDELVEHARALRAAEHEGTPRGAEELAALAPDTLAGLEASEPAKAVTKDVGGVTVPSAVRLYAEGERTLRLRITDTAAMESMRRTFAQRLTTVGAEQTGQLRGRIEGERAFLHAYRPDARRSLASSFVAERYLLEADVRGARGADDALEALQALDVSSLSPAR